MRFGYLLDQRARSGGRGLVGSGQRLGEKGQTRVDLGPLNAHLSSAQQRTCSVAPNKRDQNVWVNIS
jgi:hypothetical protein